MNKKKEITLIIIIGVALCVAIIRLFYLGFFQENKYAHFQSVESHHHKTARYSIVDVNGAPLAISQEKYNVYLNTKKRALAVKALQSLSGILNIQTASLTNILDKNKVVLISRFIDKKKAEAIYKINNNSILLEKLYKRVYPQQKTLSHTLGFMSYNGEGLIGLEKTFDNFLNVKNKSDRNKEVKLMLTINLALQHKVEKELQKVVDKKKAISGTVIVQELATGKIRALANVPSFNPNYFAKSDFKLFNNIAISKPAEPGSIFKVFFFAYLLERFPNINIYAKNYHSPGFYELKNGKRIKDSIAYGDISLADIMKHSINSGIIGAIEKFTQKEMEDYLKRFQFRKPLNIDLPNEATAIFPKSNYWGLRTKATIVIGQGIAVTPLQLINSFSSLVYDGLLKKPQIIEARIEYKNNALHTNRTPVEVLGRVIETNTVLTLRKLMRYGTIPGSTGALANQNGFISIGKTSTSQLVNRKQGGYYTNRYDAMFIGAYPPQNPRVAILVIITNPTKGKHSGGNVAAPLYANLLPEVIYQLNIQHNRQVLAYKNKNFSNQTSTAIDIAIKKETLPNFNNLSLRNALVVLKRYQALNKEHNITYTIKGSGYVQSQTPAGGTVTTNNLHIQLKLK